MSKTTYLLVLVIALWLLSPAPQTAETAMEVHGLHAEWLNEFLAAVRESADRAPASRNARDRVLRYIHDVEYHVEQMVAQAKKADRARAEEEGQRLMALLQRGQAKGYLSPKDVESLIQRLNKYLPLVEGFGELPGSGQTRSE
jgi:hypothetical protein